MSSPSNLYAEKIFSEHPIAFWALDDVSDYTSLINDEDRDLTNWEDSNPGTRSGISGGSAEPFSAIDEPFINSPTTTLTGNLTEESFGQIECISLDNLNGNGINLLDLDSDLATFSIGAYFYTDSKYLSSIELGYEYYDTVSGENVQITKLFNTTISGRWIFLSETFSILNQNTTIRLVVKISYVGGSESQEDYKFLINGLSVGQWSEEFNSTSLGSSIEPIPSTIAIDAYGIEAKAYGLQNLPGYYLANASGSLTAKNSGIPMVYGSSNITKISPNGNLPSLIVPGNGFLNEGGRYGNYTFEFWAKISCDSVEERKIFGPIASDDGLYVRGPFITLKVGKFFETHYVGEWLRPMLFQIRYTLDSTSLLINGERVLSIDIVQEDIDFPDKINNDGNSQDWLGFYSYADVGTIELDCVAIYPYQVSEIMAKRRWVYGQGVEFPENINTAYSGTSIFIDYPFANYSNSYSYPDFGSWDQGTVDNLISEKNILSIPQYSLPSVIFNNKSSEDWMADLSEVQNESKTFISLKPKDTWSSTNGHILVDTIDIVQETPAGFYGVFKQKVANESREVLFEIEDESTLDYFQISIEDHEIIYTLKYRGSITEVYRSQAQYVGSEFSIGVNIKSFVEYFGGNLPAFFGKKSSLKFYVGGNRSFSNTFSGNIYSIGISTPRNFSKISNFFNLKGLCLDNLDVFGADGGIPETTYWSEIYDGDLPSTSNWDSYINPDSSYPTPALISAESLTNFISSYTIKLNQRFEKSFLDISADSYWEDYIPLTYFAKYKNDATGDQAYGLDFIQFNLNYPAPSKYKTEKEPESWTYDELLEEYSIPTRRSYESLDNSLFTGYENYEDLKNRSTLSYKYDTEGSLLKSYISFQYLATGANALASNFPNTVLADKNGVVIPGTHLLGYAEDGSSIYDNFENTRYEVVDNMIIYPPRGIDFNELAIVTHLEFTVDGISENPVKIKKLQYASQAFNDTVPTEVGTRFGTKLYPYTQSGVYYDYRSRNPFAIYKGSTPYLYLTRSSGIELKGNYNPLVNRGIQTLINQSSASDYKVIAAQMAIRYDQDFFPYAPTEVFQIQSKKSLIKFYLVANHPEGKRAKIYAVNATTGRVENGIAFYLNGKLVKDPVITVKEWGMIGISFSNSLNFENYVGALRLTGPLLINSISYYNSTNLQEVQQITNRPWFRVESFGETNFDWDYWDASYIWNGVLVLATTSYYGVNPEDIYKTYTGTNKIIVDDTRPLTFKSYEYKFLNDVLWQSEVMIPA